METGFISPLIFVLLWLSLHIETKVSKREEIKTEKNVVFFTFVVKDFHDVLQISSLEKKF